MELDAKNGQTAKFAPLIEQKLLVGNRHMCVAGFLDKVDQSLDHSGSHKRCRGMQAMVRISYSRLVRVTI